MMLLNRVGVPEVLIQMGRPHSKKKVGGKTAVKATLNEQVVHFLVRNCLPHRSLKCLDCFTHHENIVLTGERYRVHPMMFMGDAWYDFAMVCWQSCTHPKLPACICTILDLTNLTPGRKVQPHTWQ
jgi:hypothetical protein